MAVTSETPTPGEWAKPSWKIKNVGKEGRKFRAFAGPFADADFQANGYGHFFAAADLWDTIGGGAKGTFAQWFAKHFMEGETQAATLKRMKALAVPMSHIQRRADYEGKITCLQPLPGGGLPEDALAFPVRISFAL